MRNLLALLAFAVLAFAGVGWYLGWYQVKSTQTGDGRQITIDLNTPKINQDLNTGKEKLRDLLTTKEKESSQLRTILPGHPDNGGVIPVSFRVSADGKTITSSDPTLPALPIPPSR